MDKNFYISAREKEEDWKKEIITPRVAAVGIVESNNRENLLIIERKYPPLGFAFPGGMMEIGETIEETAIREVLEETGIDVEPIGLLNVVSNPEIDPRWHVVIIYLVMRAKDEKEPKGNDDANMAFWSKYNKLPQNMTNSSNSSYKEYLNWREKGWHLPKTR